MSIIRGSWENLKLLCGNHAVHPERAVEMELRADSRTMSYVCPCFEEKNRRKGELPCQNEIGIVDFEKMLDKVNSLIVDGDTAGEIMNLKNYEWKNRKGMIFKVMKHDGDLLEIEMVNKASIRK